MPRVRVADLQLNMQLYKAPFLLASLKEATDRNGNPYLKLTLRDSTGDVEARYWCVPAGVAERLNVGQGVAVCGQVTEYRGALQVTINHAFPCELEDLTEYLPAARRPMEEMVAELDRLISSVGDVYLGQLLHAILGSRPFRDSFCVAPAAKTYHHACVGGLLEHSLDVARQILLIAERYPELDRDLGVTVALLHDVGKVDSYDLGGGFELTDSGRLLGHIYLGTVLVERAIDEIEGFPTELRLRVLHAILAHHGSLENGSPVTPRTPEAIALHYADHLDGSLRGWVDHVGRGRVSDNGWTAWSNMHGGELFVGRWHGDE